MRVLFCGDPLDPRRPDADYQGEAATAKSVGLETSLIDFEALVSESDADRAVRRVAPPAEEEVGVYRGWMVTPAQYADLYEALLDRRVRFINDPAAYEHCHYLPRSYDVIRDHTPRTIWATADEGLSTWRLLELLAPFGPRPVIVKDFVKSRKHEWHEACFIPSATDAEAVERVVARFLERQGGDLNVGLVFREFVDLDPLTDHSRSGMPLTKEFRIFFLDGAPIQVTRYWDEGDYEGVTPPVDQFHAVARNVRSRFFTMDVARRRDGGWTIIELGDAQVAELSESADAGSFYTRLAERLPSS